MALTKIPTNLITADAIDGTLIANNAINSEHYTDGSIDTAHIAADQITSALIADDQIDSEHIVDGSIDLAHMSVNSIDSDQYIDGSIDNAHLADDAVGIAELSATGSASSSTFLRGDNSWQSAADATKLPLAGGTLTGALVGTSSTMTGGFLGGSNGGIRIHSSGAKFFNITAANAAQDATMDIGAADARFKDLHLSGVAYVDGGAIFNEDSADVDFRVESNGNANMLFVDGGNDRVGIGYGTPAATLDIRTTHTSTDVTAANTNSTLIVGNIGSGNSVYNAIKFAGNQQDMYMMSVNHGTQASRRIGLFVGSVAGDATTDERLSILGDGKVGIGTSSPAHMLHLSSTGDAGIHIQADSDNSGEGDNPYLSFSQDGSSAKQFYMGIEGDANTQATGTLANSAFIRANNDASQPIHIAHMDSVVATFRSGKVGINDTSPTYTLDVDGDINFTGSLREDGTALNTASLHSYNIDFLVIAGGGQGGDQHGGGGGAGGYRNSYGSETSGRGASSETPITTESGVVYTCTVGAGATTSHPGSGQDGADGSNSSISGSGLSTITCTGGGGGAGHADGGATGRNGGCGGGSGLTGVGGDGVASQGYDGGDNPGSGYASWPNVGAGGGGAGAAGGAGNANSSGNANGWGGTGLASSITGSSVVRGGGGGGGSHAPHTPATGSDNLGAAGGGGTGGVGNSSSTHATNGTDAKGGGGGGSNGAGQTCGGGGDGIIILRMPTAKYSGTTTGSPTATTSGTDTILTFTGTGTYTS